MGPVLAPNQDVALHPVRVEERADPVSYPDPMPTKKKEEERVDPRTEAAIVREYLDALARHRRPKGRRNAAYLTKRLEEINQQLAEGVSSAMQRVELIQERMDCEADLTDLEDTAAFEAAEKQFIEHGGAWAERKGITKAALREFGVTPAVLRQAGIAQ